MQSRNKFFWPLKNFTADLHHDFFQGGLMHTVKIVFWHNLIFVSGFFTLEELNKRLNNFVYGRDVDGKPSEFTEERLIVFF